MGETINPLEVPLLDARTASTSHLSLAASCTPALRHGLHVLRVVDMHLLNHWLHHLAEDLLDDVRDLFRRRHRAKRGKSRRKSRSAATFVD